MKRKILIIVLCLACSASFAQNTKKKGKGTTTKPKTTKPVAVTPPPVDTVKKTLVVKDAPVNAPVNKPAGPSKPFERPLDGYFKKNDVINARVTPYVVVREADIVYKRRIWRQIDLREKMNQYLASPKARLIDVFMDAIAAGELTAYDPIPTKDDLDGDAFGTPMAADKAKAAMADSTIVTKVDKNGDKVSSTLVAGEFNPDSVLRFMIKEDVIFDKQRSVEETRIIGIAPMIKRKVAGVGIAFDYQPAFWIYFPAARQILVTKETVNSRNDAAGLSFDDIFTKRMFTSFIVKQSNDRDEKIKEYAQGIDRLYESERIKKTLMDWELNLWQY
ncbi:MAG: type IX secretion system ring subunit PorN/GldN [Mucilaginibacter sp.]